MWRDATSLIPSQVCRDEIKRYTTRPFDSLSRLSGRGARGIVYSPETEKNKTSPKLFPLEFRSTASNLEAKQFPRETIGEGTLRHKEQFLEPRDEDDVTQMIPLRG